MRGEHAGSCITFPIKLRCSSPADLLSEPELEAAITRALGRAFARLRTEIPPAVAFGGGVRLEPPYLLRAELPNADQATLLARVQRAIEAAARAQSLPRVWVEQTGSQGDRRQSAPDTMAAPRNEVAERFDPKRFELRNMHLFSAVLRKKGKAPSRKDEKHKMARYS